MSLLITADDLAALLEERPVHLLDVRWRLDRPDCRADFAAGHLPGAVYVDLDSELAAHGRPATDGRHPLPDRGDLEEAARRWGLRRGETVVVYDDLGGMSAARAWWVLTDAGVADVRILDGALSAWTDAGLPLETGETTPERGDIELDSGHLPSIDASTAAELPEHGTLLDARAGERYRGEVEPIDPRAGHIPGARSTPAAANLDERGRFRSPDELRDTFLAAGVDPEAPVAVYCGSGVTAAHTIAALTIAGFEPALYAGSWSAWSNDPARPAATGSGPEVTNR